jgi:hypothetical protein
MSWQIARRLPRFWVSSARVAHLNKKRGSSEPFDEVAPSRAMENGTITLENRAREGDILLAFAPRGTPR